MEQKETALEPNQYELILKELDKDSKRQKLDRDKEVDMEQYLNDIADESDSDLTFWQRMVRVNKFISDLQVRKQIEALCKPIFDNQIRLESDLMANVKQQVESVTQRVQRLEDDLYDRQTREDKLSRIEQKISDETKERKSGQMVLQLSVTEVNQRLDTVAQLEKRMD